MKTRLNCGIQVKSLKLAGLFVLTETLIGFNAALAAEYPGLYGGFITLASPLAGGGRLNGAGNTAAMFAAMAIGQYNFNYVPRRSGARHRRFWVTFIGFHALEIISGGVDRLTGGATCRDSAPKAAKRAGAMDFYAAPNPGGAEFYVSRRF